MGYHTDLWYGRLPFDPATTGSTLLLASTPAVRAVAEHHIGYAPEYYGTSESAIVREAQRLANLWNGMWCHHITQDDVDALVAAGRLHDFTHTWGRDNGWQPIEPPVTPTAAQVNDWSLRGIGHDSINAGVVITARCKREGIEEACATCGGHSTLEVYPDQRAEAEAWEGAGPPEGEGWQLWETVSEGSPVSPVFATPEELATWMSDDQARDAHSWVPYPTALAFIREGWAPSLVMTPELGVASGVEFIGHTADGGSDG
jgi:hypothetical protein